MRVMGEVTPKKRMVSTSSMGAPLLVWWAWDPPVLGWRLWVRTGTWVA
jgi:hypothetical protein